MKLIWHIVLKDFRRLWLSLTVWLVLLLAQLALLVRAGGLSEPTTSDYEGLGYFAMTWRMIVIAVGFILAASLVMEDSLVASRAFWRTRPLGGMRLLAAKSLGALLMFSVLPVLVLTPVWWWCGFSQREWAGSAWELAVVQGGCTVAAFALACITEKSGQFLVRGIAAGLLFPVGLAFVLGGIGSKFGMGDGLGESRRGLVMGLLILTPVVLIVHQFVTRHTRRSYALVGLAVVLMLGVRYAWPWDLPEAFPAFFQRAAQPKEDATQTIEFIHADTRITPNLRGRDRSQIRLRGVSLGTPAGSFVRVRKASGHWLGISERWSAMRFTAENRVQIPVEVLRQSAGLASLTESGRWSFESEENNERLEAVRRKGMKLETKINATLMQGRVLGELPLHDGVELRVGASYTRILGVQRIQGRILVRLEERDAWPTSTEGFSPASSSGLPSFIFGKARPALDGFLVLNRTTGDELVSDVSDVGIVRVNSIMVGQRNIAVTPPTRLVNGHAQEIPGWEEGVIIVKVRFAPDLDFTRTLVTDPFPAVR